MLSDNRIRKANPIMSESIKARLKAQGAIPQTDNKGILTEEEIKTLCDCCWWTERHCDKNESCIRMDDFRRAAKAQHQATLAHLAKVTLAEVEQILAKHRREQK